MVFGFVFFTSNFAANAGKNREIILLFLLLNFASAGIISTNGKTCIGSCDYSLSSSYKWCYNSDSNYYRYSWSILTQSYYYWDYCQSPTVSFASPSYWVATASGNSYTISWTSQHFTLGTSFDISLVYDRDGTVVYEKIAVSMSQGSTTFVIKTNDLQPAQTPLNYKIRFSNPDIDTYSTKFIITYTFPSGTQFGVVPFGGKLELGAQTVSPGYVAHARMLYDTDQGSIGAYIRNDYPPSLFYIFVYYYAFLYYDDYTHESNRIFGVKNCGEDTTIPSSFYLSFVNENVLSGSINVAYIVSSSFEPTCGSKEQRETAFMASQFSNLAYVDPPPSFFMSNCLSWSLISHTTVADLWKSGNTYLLAFKGTTTTTEGLSDVEAFPEECAFPSSAQCSGTMHSGFLDIWQSADQNWIRLNLRKSEPTHNLIITGHSLGGALATIAAYDLLLNSDFKKYTLVTFGSPRVGKRDFVDGFKNAAAKKVFDSWRFVNSAKEGSDPICFVPSYTNGWRHVQNSTILSQDEYYSEYISLNTYLKGKWFHDSDLYESSIEKNYKISCISIPAPSSVGSRDCSTTSTSTGTCNGYSITTTYYTSPAYNGGYPCPSNTLTSSNCANCLTTSISTGTSNGYSITTTYYTSPAYNGGYPCPSNTLTSSNCANCLTTSTSTGTCNGFSITTTYYTSPAYNGGYPCPSNTLVSNTCSLNLAGIINTPKPNEAVNLDMYYASLMNLIWMIFM